MIIYNSRKWRIGLKLRSFKEISRTKLFSIVHFKENGEVYGSWYDLSFLRIDIDNMDIDCFALCKMCESPDIGEVGYGDEGWTVCQECGSVEQGYIYVNQRELEERGLA